MRARSIGLAGTLVVGVALAATWTFRAAGQQNDADAIRQVLQKYVSTINSAEFAKGPRERRAEMLRAYYRPDNSFAKGEAPTFFGPLSEPVSHGLEAHLDNTLLNFEYLFRQKMTYGLRIDETQIETGGGLGAVIALTTSGYASADGKTNYVSHGRATLIFNKMSNGEWRISHEHLELYNAAAPGMMSKQQLTAAVEKLPK